MVTKKKSAQEEESISGYKEFLADLGGIKKKKPVKKKSYDRKKV